MRGSTTPGFDAVEVENIPRLTGGKPFFTAESTDVLSENRFRINGYQRMFFSIRRPTETQIDWPTIWIQMQQSVIFKAQMAVVFMWMCTNFRGICHT